ncbi:hypothetical protein [uncultured Bacteroides sp.]|uniref:hypothetical protein n=1 Tax=uncultured Bacteroides sp. TaxID=162156 RepID=UPI0025E376A9|nr:hypothetical protein [uncultured Bacteroides sp.]
MKSKLLFGALLGSIALASCNADEDFSASSVQESPIKFTVSLETANGETPLTKAILTDKFKINFENNDLMSLFHGVTVDASAGDQKQTMVSYQNAIYAGTAEDGNAFSFTTKSMVLEGKAIMVYPADTTFVNGAGTNAPKVSIARDQDENTVKLMPYMSEVLDIVGRTDGTAGANTSGYGKYYPIVLKPIGSVLALQINPTNVEKINNLGVAELKVTKAGLEASGNIFTTGLHVKATDDAIGYTGSDDLIKALWNKASDVDLTESNLTLVNSLTTTNVSNDKAVFTLLPAKSSIDATGAAVTINTNYGKVVLDENVETWVKGSDAAVAVKVGIENVLNNTWVAPGTSSSNFGNEKTGGLFNRKITADMSTLDMDGLHITDQQHLLDALKVYDAIAENEPVTFYLDGDADGEFVMEAEATAAYEARVANVGNQITFELSTGDPETECSTVKFVSTEETEVPAVLKFGTNAAQIKFAGTWKYSENKTFDYVASLEIVEGATMTMTNAIKATATNPSAVVITNNGTVNISGTTDLALNMNNNGTINIPADAKFFMNGAELTNKATETEYGAIYNAGRLGVRTEPSTGKINNYGYIKQENASAYTYVSTNAMGTGFTAAFADEANEIGTIELFETGNENTVVASGGKAGFIKVITTAASVTDAEIGTKANYVVITGNCTSLGDISDSVSYIDIQSSSAVVWNTTGKTYAGLIVGEGHELNIPKGSSVTITTAYVKGYIYKAGTLNCSDFDGYLGGADTDKANIIAQ